MLRFSLCFLVLAIAGAAHGDTASERAYFERAVKRNPNDLQTHLNYQQAALKEGDRAALLKFYAALLKDHPDSGLYLYLYGRLLEDADQSRAYLQRAVKADSTLYNARFDLARSHYYAGHYDDAIHHFRTALRLKPQSALARNLIGLAYYHRGHPQQAIAEYQRAVAAQPDYVDAWFNLGLACYFTDQFENAVKAYRQAIKHAKPDDEPHLIYHSLGAAYRKLDRIADARSAYQAALKRTPQYAEAHVSLGNLAISEGDYAQAVEHYEKAIDTKADTADLHLRIGLAHFNHKAYGRAIQALKTAQSRNPTDVKLLFYLGQAYYLNSQPDSAEVALQAYIDGEKSRDQQSRIAQVRQLLYEIKRDRIADILR